MVDLPLNSLLQRPATLTPVVALPPALLRPQVIEAVVLASTPLLATPGAAQTQQSGHRLVLLVGGEKVEVNAQQTWPRGTLLQLRTDGSGRLTLVPATPPLPAQTEPAQRLLQTALREVLPRQQPLAELVPLLRQLQTPAVPTSPAAAGAAASASAALPAPIQRALGAMLERLPTASALQQPANLRSALRDSGPLLEARLAQMAPGSGSAASLASPPGADLKAQMARLLAALPPSTRPEAANAAAAPLPNRAAASDEAASLYRPERLAADLPLPTTTTRAPQPAAEDTDILLRQLGKLLLAGLARTQVHQLDAVAQRLAPADPQQPTNSWVLELPVMHRERVDNLQLRIAEYAGGSGADPAARVWTVDLAFDLHAAGKLQVRLRVLGQTVAADLWAERAALHQAARQHLEELRGGLESAGVKVRELNCHRGLPDQPARGWNPSLVDLHT